MQSCVREYNCVRPYTKKEKKFVDSLETNGIKVSLFRFNYKAPDERVQACGWRTDYSVEIFNEKYETINNLDSIRFKTRAIASELFNHVIEDSLLVFIPEIKISVSSKKTKKYSSYGNIYQATFIKEDLESFCGFTVKGKYNRTFKDVFYREKVNIKWDTLNIYEEHWDDLEKR